MIIQATLEDLEKEFWLRAREKGVIQWETRDGKMIPINNMTDDHLCKAILYILRRREKEEQAEAYAEFLQAQKEEYEEWAFENLTD